MKALLGGIGIGLVFLLGWLLLSSSPNENPPTSPPTNGAVLDDGLPQLVRPIDLSGPFSFAGKTLPMDNFDVRERLDLELMRNAYFHRNTLLLLKRQGRYFPIIERILAEEGVPDDLKYLAAAESTLTEAVSPAGAKGVWQFMAPTGRAYGLEINDEVDERFHLEKATRAAAAYLKDYYEDFGDWNKVAAAYNMGGPNLKKWLDRQRAEELYDLDINQETMQYLFRIVALKAIMERPEEFGYRVPDGEFYPVLDNYRTVTVDTSIANLGDFARQQGTTYRMLKLYNPWLVTGNLTVSRGNSYELRIP
ncbi:transglycosylase-like protein with SLT domain [Neolewinella xylanilytica]|uniref:Transglycosylase-like protein with SLT domain n=1 Tax=Neolewinella xylanilytica TaxID=1514080 RepID=A0A2S6I5F7_9BACT|nr:lytic transglycosylase domain-containing protein [Neolewinella xylanilytica]PPK86385.1 transglycosylase-like protein with SLT domain [Neolewinella xylanilytica]